MRTFRLLSTALAACVGLAAPLPAQVGVKIGLSLATLTEAADQRDWSTQIGLGAGVALRLPILPGLLAFQPEALYVEKGGKLAPDGAENRIGYLDVPLLLRVSLPTPGAGLFAVGGPVGSLRATCPRGVQTCGQIYRRFDVGLAAGGGIRLGGWTIEGRWTAGFTNINAGNQGFDTRTRTILVLFGLSY